jgi:hypothetical protein
LGDACPLCDAPHVELDAHSGAERFFVLKAKSRPPIIQSQASSVWATRTHMNCDDSDQPHNRFKKAGAGGPVYFLFFEHSEHAWVGHAQMRGDFWCEDGSDFPNHFGLNWKSLLPQARGVDFRAVAIAVEQDAHKVFTGDELPGNVGRAIRDAIDAVAARIRVEEDAKRRTTEESAFMLCSPRETELQFHRRLRLEVQRRLGPMILSCLCGSRRYNLHFPESDWDLLVVYAARDITSTHPVIKNPDGMAPDYTLLEVGRFVEMLLDGDPRMIECLFLGAQSEQLFFEDVWKSITAVNSQFLCQSMVKKYLSDATGRAGLAAVRRGSKASRHAKIMYIAFRSLTNALQVCRREAPQIWRPGDSEERAQILGIRQSWSELTPDAQDALVCRAEQLADEVRLALDTSMLPETPAPDVAEVWLSKVRAWSAQASQ